MKQVSADVVLRDVPVRVLGDQALEDGVLRVKIVEGSLYPFQSDGVAFLLSKKRAILADDMGLGKTRQAIVAMEAGRPEGTILVVCPASIKLNWKREILMVDDEASIEVLGVDNDHNDAPRWIIINYDILAKQKDAIKAVGFQSLIFDESHYAKTSGAQRTKALKEIAEGIPAMVLALTGTPVAAIAISA